MKHKVKENFLINNPEYNILYQNLLKEARIWNNSGQYWLGREAEKKALALLNGRPDEASTITKTEQFFFKTKKYLDPSQRI